MKRIFPLILSFVSLLFLFLFVPASHSQNQAQSDRPVLKLHRGTFDVAEGRALTAVQGPATPIDGYAIVQFDRPITVDMRQALADTGVRIWEYLPDYAYLVEGTKTQLARTERLPHFYGRAPFTVADKFSPAVLTALAKGESVQVRAIAWPGRYDRLEPTLQRQPFRLNRPLAKESLVSLAQLSAVRWIEPEGNPHIVNETERQVTGVNQSWEGSGLYGEGQILGIADSGLDTGSLGTLSADFSGRVAATFVLSDGGDWGDQNGHGTHVAGTAVGSGALSGANTAQNDFAGSFAGVAPKADLVVQGFEADNATGAIIGLPSDYYDIFAQAYYSAGVRLHSNSWGDTTGATNQFGGYPFGAMRTDQFIWEHPDMTIFAAAGNSGKDGAVGALGLCSGGDGVVDPDSLLSPGTAKNVITVGASESFNTGGASPFAWLGGVSLCFTVQPIATDYIADDPNGMAAFSSRGPTDDGRVKPDIVAPGTNVVSARSHDPNAGTLWMLHETNADYVYSGGTSMATPHVAGIGTLVRQWLTVQGESNPSAAVVKAVLLNAAQNIAPGQYGIGPQQEIPSTWPNPVAGWGRADLRFMAPDNLYHHLWYDDHTAALATNDTVTYKHSITKPLTVLTDTVPLRVLLTWTDPPASLSAGSQLVNDLDLTVTGPGGITYTGNTVSGGDRVNNVEGVILDTPGLGTYTVTVSAFNVPTATQPYALAVSGGLVEPVNEAPTAVSDIYSTTHNINMPLVVPGANGLLANDLDDSFGLPLTATVITPPAVGTLDLELSGAFTYTAPFTHSGTVTFTYAASDGLLNSAETMVTIDVYPAPCETLSAAAVSVSLEQLGDHAYLIWGDYAANTGGYAIYGHSTAYFPQSLSTRLSLVSSGSTSYIHANAMNNPPMFYTVEAHNCDGSQVANSNHVGMMQFDIVPGD